MQKPQNSQVPGGINPNGALTLISNLRGGNVFDQYLTKQPTLELIAQNSTETVPGTKRNNTRPTHTKNS